jgi:hypothetical protein
MFRDSSLSSKTETKDHKYYLIHRRKSYHMMLTQLEPKTLAIDFLKGTCLKEKQSMRLNKKLHAKILFLFQDCLGMMEMELTIGAPYEAASPQ